MIYGVLGALRFWGLEMWVLGFWALGFRDMGFRKGLGFSKGREFWGIGL